MQNSIVHWGDYGCGLTREKAASECRGDRAGLAWHSSLSPDEVTRWLRVWGVVGERRNVVRIVRRLPAIDKGPGIGTYRKKDGSDAS